MHRFAEPLYINTLSAFCQEFFSHFPFFGQDALLVSPKGKFLYIVAQKKPILKENT